MPRVRVKYARRARVRGPRDLRAAAVYTASMSTADAAPPLPDRAVALPAAPVLVAGIKEAAWLSPDGEITLLPVAAAARRARAEPPILCHARATARRLGVLAFPALDVLELFAFVRPAQFCLPTPRGLALAVGLETLPHDLAAAAAALREVARRLLTELGAGPADADARAIAVGMERGGWGWAAAVLAALLPGDDATPAGLAQWRWLPEWSEFAPEPSPGHFPVEEQEARERLAELLGRGAEARPQQADYAAAVSAAFRPRERVGEPHVVLAEAGTGVGKTLGYIAPASVWAEKNEGAVWVSTFTRNLQHQIVGELDRLYPDPAEKERRVVLRKGRENYLCLLNFEEAVAALPMRPYDAAALGIMARWVGATRDGDMVGGDLPGWFPDVIGRAQSVALADRRGECIHSACPHYHRCFIEKSVRRARRARIVVANHALVMIQAALGGLDDASLPTRYVFDEGHHVFDAADNTFALELGGREAAELQALAHRRRRARPVARPRPAPTAGRPGRRRWCVRARAAGRGAGRACAAGRGLPAAHPRRPAAGRMRGVARAGAAAGAGARHGARAGLQPGDRAAAAGGRARRRRAGAGAEAHGDRGADAGAGRTAGAAGSRTRRRSSIRPTRIRIEAAVRGLVRRGSIEIGGWRRMLEEIAGEPRAQIRRLAGDRAFRGP